MSPEITIWIGLGGTTKLTANITTTSVDSIKIYWQRVENNSIVRNIVLNTTKYSGSSCDVPVPELVINDVDTTDAGLYQIKVTTITGSFIGPHVVLEVFGGKLFLVLCVYFVDRFVLLYFFFWPLCCLQGLQETFYLAEQNCFVAPGQAETSLKIEDLRFN
jgi:hypothetical protein